MSQVSDEFDMCQKQVFRGFDPIFLTFSTKTTRFTYIKSIFDKKNEFLTSFTLSRPKSNFAFWDILRCFICEISDFCAFSPTNSAGIAERGHYEKTRYTLPAKCQIVELPSLEPDGPLIEGATLNQCQTTLNVFQNLGSSPKIFVFSFLLGPNSPKKPPNFLKLSCGRVCWPT